MKALDQGEFDSLFAAFEAFCKGGRRGEFSFKDIDISNVSLGGREFSRCVFENVRFGNAASSAATFKNCQIKDCTFGVNGVRDCTFVNTGLYDCRSEGESAVRFTNCTFHDGGPRNFQRPSVFRKCRFPSATVDSLMRLATFDRCDIRECRFECTQGNRLAFYSCDGLFGPRKANFVWRSSEDERQDDAIFSRLPDFGSWERLGKIGKSRLFAVSYTVLIVLTIYLHLAGAFNGAASHVSTWTGEAFGVELHLPHLPVGWQQFWMLEGVIALAFAATVYKYRCPSIVQEFSEPVWHYEMKESLYEYRGASWSRLGSRLVCAVLYGLSLPAFLLLAYRIVTALLISVGC